MSLFENIHFVRFVIVSHICQLILIINVLLLQRADRTYYCIVTLILKVVVFLKAKKNPITPTAVLSFQLILEKLLVNVP